MKITAICPRFRRQYAQYGEDIGFIAVSVEEQETVQSLAAARVQNELTDLPLSLGGLSAFGQFGSAYIPLTVVVNADGTSGFEFDGVLGAEALERVLAVFVRTDGAAGDGDSAAGSGINGEKP